MKTMTALEAKNRFGEFLDAMQREPVLVTKNKRPVGVMLSMEDAARTLVPDIFFDKEEGYDEWFKQTVTNTMTALREGRSELIDHDMVMARAAEKLRKLGERE
ncbi:MAG: type II toxin-antitoxin system Phd/YefM family antitoxin [Azoarcus sp.]|jgi:prevent-host-death family protein|nr:type II toxin-antitoxin system Phd/YefM family antitoxin [Azoarcus sp.]